MTAAQFETLAACEAEELIRARFECLAYHGCAPETALLLAVHVDVELPEIVELLDRGCPDHLVLPILR